jgi:hypothetical protein
MADKIWIQEPIPAGYEHYRVVRNERGYIIGYIYPGMPWRLDEPDGKIRYGWGACECKNYDPSNMENRT